MRLLLAASLSGTLLLAAAASATAIPVPSGSGPEGSASMHGDSLNSDTTPYAGPGADAQPGVATPLPGVCPTILAGADGLVQALCTEYDDRAPTLRLLDPDTGEVLASHDLARGSTLGGVYAYVDDRDRMITVDGERGLVALAHEKVKGAWAIRVDRAWSVAPLMRRACGSSDCDTLVSVAPGYDGRIWFATAGARVGYVDGREQRIRRLGRGEAVFNSIGAAPQGVAVTTDHATYLVKVGPRGGIRQVWRRGYDRGEARKPGKLSCGSGTSPTFFGPRGGSRFLAVADNAEPRERLFVLRAATGKKVCSAPILSRDNGGTENSPIGWGRRVFVASTYGYTYPPTAADGESEPPAAEFVGGMQAFTITREGTCRADWTNDVRSSAVPKLSRPEGVIYTVDRDPSGAAWSLVRIDPATGQTLSSTPLATGPQSDTLQMVGTFLPDGTLLQGTVSGLVTVRPPD